MSYVFVTHYKSNKAPSYQGVEAETVEEARSRAEAFMNASIDISDVSIYEFMAMASKVEIINWS